MVNKKDTIYLYLNHSTKNKLTMANRDNNWKDRLNIVYSTNPDFKFETDNDIIEEVLPKQQQILRIFTEKRNRGGKTVTVIKGFVGPENELKELAKYLKRYCGTGGSVKDGEIIIQGEFKQKLKVKLKEEGYINTK